MIFLLANNLQKLDDNKVGFSNHLLEIEEKVFIGDINTIVFRNNEYFIQGTDIKEPLRLGSAVSPVVETNMRKARIIWPLNQPAECFKLDVWSMLYAIYQETPMVNDPSSMLLVNNKAFLSAMPSKTRPKGVISSFKKDHQNFARTQTSIIKPLNDGCGNGVFQLGAGNTNDTAIIQYLCGGGSGDSIHSSAVKGLDRQYAYTQEQIADSVEYRLIIAAGEVIGVHGRSRTKEHRGNISQSGIFFAVHDIAGFKDEWAWLAKKLTSLRLNYCGLDIIGGKLLEFNLVDPGGLFDIQQEQGLDLFPEAWERIRAAVS
ncbi:ATP-grasp domain-containing protein [Reinekea forsetii]|uniref:Glutathione synthase n=1 Tax=Reinekea forsetii TaxID=1336806 RepID=A0A2K8KWM6_9GAMM|nr:hypothetical protein [Reinekea forsetii]ATX77086.1 glutathione synthase [Reinekea forsetii]